MNDKGEVERESDKSHSGTLPFLHLFHVVASEYQNRVGLLTEKLLSTCIEG